MRRMDCVATILVLAVALLLAAVPSQATTPLPVDHEWKYYPAPPDGIQRSQFHEFLNNPNNDPPENTYNGYDINPLYPDEWTIPNVPAGNWGVDIPNGPNPFVSAENGQPFGDGKGLKIEAEHSFTFSKRMGNKYDITKIKLFYISIFWYAVQGTDPYVDPSVTLNVTPTTESRSSVTQQYGDTEVDGNWYHSWLAGTITPQPDWETFTIDLTPGPSGKLATVYIDRVSIKTLCIPEPSCALALCMGLLGAMTSVRRRA